MTKAQRDAAVRAVAKVYGYPDLSAVPRGFLIWSLHETAGQQFGKIVDIAFAAAAKAAPKPPRKASKRKAKRSR